MGMTTPVEVIGVGPAALLSAASIRPNFTIACATIRALVSIGERGGGPQFGERVRHG